MKTNLKSIVKELVFRKLEAEVNKVDSEVKELSDYRCNDQAFAADLQADSQDLDEEDPHLAEDPNGGPVWRLRGRKPDETTWLRGRRPDETTPCSVPTRRGGRSPIQGEEMVVDEPAVVAMVLLLEATSRRRPFSEGARDPKEQPEPVEAMDILL